MMMKNTFMYLCYIDEGKQEVVGEFVDTNQVTCRLGQNCVVGAGCRLQVAVWSVSFQLHLKTS